MNTLTILDRPIAFHRSLVAITGSVSSALLLSQAIFWQNRCPRPDGWWWKTAEDWEKETGMKRYEFEQARRDCSNYLSFRKFGIPCRTWYKVNEDELESSLQKICKLDCRKNANKPADSMQAIPNTSSKISSRVDPQIPVNGNGEGNQLTQSERYSRERKLADLKEQLKDAPDFSDEDRAYIRLLKSDIKVVRKELGYRTRA